jgi:hypothetical protein
MNHLFNLDNISRRSGSCEPSAFVSLLVLDDVRLQSNEVETEACNEMYNCDEFKEGDQM